LRQQAGEVNVIETRQFDLQEILNGVGTTLRLGSRASCKTKQTFNEDLQFTLADT
jgi:hypothetical protein